MGKVVANWLLLIHLLRVISGLSRSLTTMKRFLAEVTSYAARYVLYLASNSWKMHITMPNDQHILDVGGAERDKCGVEQMPPLDLTDHARLFPDSKSDCALLIVNIHANAAADGAQLTSDSKSDC